jgi:hypothetical protein
MSLNSQDRLNLKNLLKDSDCDDNTESIRNLKHSVLIRNDVRKLEDLKRSQSVLKLADFASFKEKAQCECPFLYNNYMDIFNKILKDEIDLKIMARLLIVLKLIEDCKVDQHEGSAMVGKILKELYIDSALKCSENLDKEHETEQIVKESGSAISWKEYKKMYCDAV